MNLRNRGFTLIELMVTVSIVAIIAAVAIPSYRQYVRRANRMDATTTLLRLASNQERFYLQHNSYASDDLLDDAPPAGLGMVGTERGLYTLSLSPAAGGYAAGYTATAAVVSGGEQSDDDDCARFTVNEMGVHGATDRNGADNTDRCWR